MSGLWTRLMFGTAIVVTACSERPTAPLISRSLPTGASRSVSSFDLSPATLDWQQQARDLAGANNLSPLAAGRVYAALSAAEYRAVMAIDDVDEDGTIPSEGLGAGGRSALEANRGAVAGASAEVLTFFFPKSAATFDQLVRTEADAQPGNVHPQFTRGLAIGRGIGDAVVDRAKGDHFTAPFTGTIPVGPGMWIANGPPAGATLSGMTRYFLTSADQFRPPPPPAFGSPEFLAALQEIRTLSDTRTLEQQALANQWNYPTGSFTPPGYWDMVTSNYVQAHGLDERGAAHAFALTNTAVMDAFVGCFDAKYHYLFIRPPQADHVITTVFPVPNHPSYPSGHSCASAAAARVLSYLFPDRADEVTGWVEDAGISRMYAGIHYRFDIDAGATLGNNVGNLAVSVDRSSGLLAALR
jgi:membrane-associated phospholipid phosphatase